MIRNKVRVFFQSCWIINVLLQRPLPLFSMISFNFVTTLTLACDQSKGLHRCGPRGKHESHTSHFWECRRMWGNEFAHSSHFGNWSLDGFPNLQKNISRVKIHWIKKFFISLEIFWNLDVWNEFVWPIWVLRTQVMAKIKVESQSAHLTLDH